MKNMFMNARNSLVMVLSVVRTNKFSQTLVASWLIALAAQVTVPFYPVPMTLQTLALALISLCLPYQVAISSVVLYLGYAATGIPVLAGGKAGITFMLFGPTAGYLLGFVVMSILTGLLMKYNPTPNTAKRFVFAILGDCAVFLLGVGHLAHLFNMEVAIKTGLVPFILGDIVKMMVAAAISRLIADKLIADKYKR